MYWYPLTHTEHIQAKAELKEFQNGLQHVLYILCYDEQF